MNKIYLHKIKEIKRNIDKDIQNHCNISKISEKYDISIRTFEDVFKYKYRCCPKDYIDTIRMKKLKSYLRSNGYSRLIETYKIAMILGFEHSTSLYNFVKRQTGLTYSEFIRSTESDSSERI